MRRDKSNRHHEKKKQMLESRERWEGGAIGVGKMDEMIIRGRDTTEKNQNKCGKSERKRKGGIVGGGCEDKANAENKGIRGWGQGRGRRIRKRLMRRGWRTSK